MKERDAQSTGAVEARWFRALSRLAGAPSPLLLLLGLGCAVGPDFKPPETPLNASWSVKDDPRIAPQVAADSSWWKSFNDATLNQLIELAYHQNLPLQLSALRIVEARARLGVATGKQFPQLQVLNADATALGLTKYTADTANLDRNSVQFELGFDAIWELDFWGKYRRGVEADAAGLIGSVAEYYYAIVTLTAEVARTYAVIRTFEVLIELAQTNVGLQEQGLQVAESRFRNGATSELDVTQATTLLESTRANIPTLQGSAQQARNALSTLLGQQTGTVEQLLAGPKQIPIPPAKVAVSVPAEMLRRRPDIRSAELFAAAQCARIGVAKAELYPSFSLFGTIGLQATTSGPGTQNLFSGDALVYSAGPRVVWPFFNYGRLKNQVRVEDAKFQQLLVNYQNTVLKAAQEVEDALTGYINAQRALVFVQGSVKAAQRSQELALVQYQEGAVDYERVLDSQRALLEQQNAMAQTTSSVTTSVIALYKALGGGWQLSQGQPLLPQRTREEMQERTDWGDVLSEPRDPETKQDASWGK